MIKVLLLLFIVYILWVALKAARIIRAAITGVKWERPDPTRRTNKPWNEKDVEEAKFKEIN